MTCNFSGLGVSKCLLSQDLTNDLSCVGKDGGKSVLGNAVTCAKVLQDEEV